jgi:hypothetical protein
MEGDRELGYCTENAGSDIPRVSNPSTKYNTNITASFNVPPLVDEAWVVSEASMERK